MDVLLTPERVDPGRLDLFEFGEKSADFPLTWLDEPGGERVE